MAAFTLPATAQPGRLGAPDVKGTELEATAPIKISTSRVKRRKARYRTRFYLGSPADICYTINGWRAFPTRDPRGYFNTNRCW
jgi:hypothetical protein